MIKHKYFPVVLCFALMVLHFFASYPGGMSADSFDQFSQTFSHELHSHHPPVMSIVWAMFNYLYIGPQTMLLFHLTLLWGGIILLYYSDRNNKFRWLYIIIPLLPNILSQSGNISKDISFSYSFFFIISTCVFSIYRNKKLSILVAFLLLLLCFYGCAVKFQAQFILPIIIFIVISNATSQNFLVKLFITSIISYAIIFSNSSIINHYSTNTQSWQYRQLFDIASIIKDLNDDSQLPQYIKNYEGYNFEDLKKKSSHRIVDALIFGENKVLIGTLDKNNLEELNDTYIKLITNHPFLYIKHRLGNVINIAANWMRPSDFPNYMDNEFIDNIGVKVDVEIHQFENNYLQMAIIKYLKGFHLILRPITANAISMIILLIYGVYIIRNFDIKNKDVQILSFVVLISLMFTLTLSVTTMSSDYRYYYIVRLLSIFSVPIFLKLKYDSKSFHKKIVDAVNSKKKRFKNE